MDRRRNRFRVASRAACSLAGASLASHSALAGPPNAGEDRPVPAIEAALLREFGGAYPAVASPSGVVREFSLTAAPSVVPLFDGRPVEVWAYDGQVAGPTLRVRLGETVRVQFTNRSPQPTTIHWHGVRVPIGMDGVPGVTQPAVQPGGGFVSEFTPKAVDGMYAAKPFDPTGFELAPGNRLDLDVTFPAAAERKRIVVSDRFTRSCLRLATFDLGGKVAPAPSFPAPAPLPPGRVPRPCLPASSSG